MTTDRPITLRLTIVHPPPGVRWAVQLGRDELLPPTSVAPDRLVFEVPLTLGPNQRGTLQLRGAAVQGPPAARFVYVNSGKRAGDWGAAWDRRAKVPLTTIDVASLRTLAGEVILEATMHGTARDGGPACASVPLVDGAWKVRARSD
jgi:hypothetical protein